MGNSVVVQGLVKRRARVLGRIRMLEKQAADLKEVSDALGVSIKTFDPTYRLNTIKPVKVQAHRNMFFKLREGSRTVLEIMRDAQDPLTIEQIAAEAEVFNLIKVTGENRKRLQAAVRTIIYKLQARDLVKEVSRDGGVQLWALR